MISRRRPPTLLTRIVLTSAFVFALAASASAQGTQPSDPKANDWPQWRGPNRDGVAPSSPRLLDKWLGGGPRLLWKNPDIQSGRDGGSSCPIVVGGKVYVYSNQFKKNQSGKKLITTAAIDRLKAKKDGRRFSPDEINRLSALCDKDFKSITEFYTAAEKCAGLGDGGDAALYAAVEDAFELNDMVFCLDAMTGKEIWRKEFPAESLRCSPVWAMWGASGTPAAAGSCVVVQGSVALYCLSLKDGALGWKVKTGFSNSSPLILGGEVINGTEPRQTDKVGTTLGGAWSAFDLATGKLLWRSKAGGSEWGASLMPWNSGAKLTLLAPGPICIDAGNGSMLGEPVQGERVGHWETPTAAGDIVLSRSESTLRAFKVALPKMGKLWDCKLGGSEFESASPLIYQGYVYMAARQAVRCLDLKTGEQKWIAPKEVNPETSTPLVVDGKLIANVGSNHAETNQTMMLRASPEKCEILGKIAHRAAPCTSPVVAGGLLFVRLLDGLACYDLRGQ